MKLRISHGAGPDDWFVVRPLEGQATTSLAGTPLTHEMAVRSLLDAGRTVFELDTDDGSSAEILGLPDGSWVLIPGGLSVESKAKIRRLTAAERDRQTAARRHHA